MSDQHPPPAPLRVPIPVVEQGGAEQGYLQTTRGVFLYYRKLGRGPLLVMVHGGPGGDHRQLTDLDRLADRNTLLYYDQRGCGHSTRGLAPGQLGWRQHVEDLEAIREAFGEQRLAVLGYSWGGILLQLYAARHPERVGRLVFVATALAAKQHRQALQATMMSRLRPETEAWMERMQRAALLDADLEWLHTQLVRRFWVEAFVHPQNAGVFDLERLGAALSGKHTAASLDELGDARDLRQQLMKVTAPALAVHGTWDPMPLVGARELVQSLPDARLIVIENCGHMPWLEAPAAFDAAVREFLAEDRAQRR